MNNGKLGWAPFDGASHSWLRKLPTVRIRYAVRVGAGASAEAK
jgi:hypothetical protein